MNTIPQMTLAVSHETELRPTAPFHFDGTVHKPSHFPSGDVLWEPGTLWITQRMGNDLFGLKLQSAGTVDEPLLRLTIFADHPLTLGEIEAVCDEVAHNYDLYLDLGPFNATLERDELMRPVLSRWRGMRNVTGPLYESMIIYIVLQNATVRRSMQMLDNLFRAYGSRLHFDGQALYGFWPPQVLDAAPEEDLRALKVGYRAKSLKRMSSQFAHGEIDAHAMRQLPNDELKRELLKLYGVGPATVWYLMSGNFHRYDAFDHISPWEQKIYSRLLFDQELVPAEQILAEVDRRWGQWKILAAHYLFKDLFWRRKHEPVPWLEKLIRL
jgi:3-methyladenine DNA glycosylase/8-oxoguanine DNA glycosylase